MAQHLHQRHRLMSITIERHDMTDPSSCFKAKHKAFLLVLVDIYNHIKCIYQALRHQNLSFINFSLLQNPQASTSN